MEAKPESKRQIKKQVVAGFVIFRRTQDGIKYLLLYKRGQYWNFPKGHFELGENSLDTALRETKEETGIDKNDMRILPEFRAYEKFYFDRGNERIFDTVILYLAETRESKVSIAPREHSGFAWFLYHDALKAIGKQYMGTKRVLKQANDFIKERQRRHQARQHTGPVHAKRPVHQAHEHPKKEKTA
jgi:8-oxo-dGTP pyrophosphatase MutT (NUDIX family)